MNMQPKKKCSWIERNDILTRVEIVTLCEHAADENGHLTVLRGFDVVYGAPLPATVPEATLALRMRFLPAEEGPHTIAIHCINPDGIQSMEPVVSAFELRANNQDRAFGYHVIVRFRDLLFTSYGEHSFDIYLDDALEARMPFWVDPPR